MKPWKPVVRELWPIEARARARDKLALKLGYVPGYCNICGHPTVFKVDHPNFREHVVCRICGSRNRQRQIATLLLSYVIEGGGRASPWLSVRDIPRETIICNAETTRALHQRLALRLGKNYISSEYIDPSLRSGESRDGMLHVDMQATHFADNSIDFILSSDVMEHVPHPLQALTETYRILKPGGCHIFTAPFYQHRFTNEVRVSVDDRDGATYLRRPWYHDDPLRAGGALVYTIFAPELLGQLEDMGFEARLCLVYSPLHGILGSNGVVIVARKAPVPRYARDWVFGDEAWPTQGVLEADLAAQMRSQTDA
jgi:predicted SAM-dependent methyltransferase